MTDTEREYRVVWSMDVSADSPEDAARKAAGYQRYAESTAVVFDVEWQDTLGDAYGTEVTARREIDLQGDGDTLNRAIGARVEIGDEDLGTVVFSSFSDERGEDRWTVLLDKGGLRVVTASEAYVLDEQEV